MGDVTLARDPLMPNPRLKPLPPLHPKLRLKLNPTTDMDTDTTPVLTDTVDTDTVISAKDQLKLNPTTDTDTVDTLAVPTDTDTDTVILAKGPLKPNLSLITDTVDTMVDTVDTTAVDTTGVEMDTSG